MCTQPSPFFHLHVWCSWVSCEGPARLAAPLVLCTSLAARRLRGSNPLSCSGKSADGALFHLLSSNPAGYGAWENNPGLGSLPVGRPWGPLWGPRHSQLCLRRRAFHGVREHSSQSKERKKPHKKTGKQCLISSELVHTSPCHPEGSCSAYWRWIMVKRDNGG